jgi:hypothetical protein
MKLGISELAWPMIDHFDKTLNALNAADISCIEMVIPKHSAWNPINVEKLKILRNMINSAHIEIKSTQSVLFNSDVTKIGDSTFLRHMEMVIDACNEHYSMTLSHFQIFIIKLYEKQNTSYSTKSFSWHWQRTQCRTIYSALDVVYRRTFRYMHIIR